MSLTGEQHRLTWLASQVLVVPDRYSDRPGLGSTARSTLTVEQMENEELARLFTAKAYKLSAKMLAGYVTGSKRTFNVEVPASWWQHLRLSAPPWYRERKTVKRYRRRHPVRMNTSSADIDFTRYLAYPLAGITLPPDEFGYGVILDQIAQNILSPWPAPCGPTETKDAKR